MNHLVLTGLLKIGELEVTTPMTGSCSFSFTTSGIRPVATQTWSSSGEDVNWTVPSDFEVAYT